MNNKHLSFFFVLFIVWTATSCSKEPNINNLNDDKNKIDIKGSLMNGDMKNPNIEAGLIEKTVYVWFNEDMGECVVSISDFKDQIVFCDTILTDSNTTARYYMGDQPLGRYHLVISDGDDKAEGWFIMHRVVVAKP